MWKLSLRMMFMGMGNISQRDKFPDCQWNYHNYYPNVQIRIQTKCLICELADNFTTFFGSRLCCTRGDIWNDEHTSSYDSTYRKWDPDSAFKLYAEDCLIHTSAGHYCQATTSCEILWPLLCWKYVLLQAGCYSTPLAYLWCLFLDQPVLVNFCRVYCK